MLPTPFFLFFLMLPNFNKIWQVHRGLKNHSGPPGLLERHSHVEEKCPATRHQLSAEAQVLLDPGNSTWDKVKFLLKVKLHRLYAHTWDRNCHKLMTTKVLIIISQILASAPNIKAVNTVTQKTVLTRVYFGHLNFISRFLSHQEKLWPP